jgi:hypothetical protein
MLVGWREAKEGMPSYICKNTALHLGQYLVVYTTRENPRFVLPVAVPLLRLLTTHLPASPG